MIKEAIFYAIQCDNCGILHNSEDTPYWSDPESSFDMARDSGWEEIDGNHYCDECHSYNDDDEFQIHLNRNGLHSPKPKK